MKVKWRSERQPLQASWKMTCEKWFLFWLLVHLARSSSNTLQMTRYCGKSVSMSARNTYGLTISLGSPTALPSPSSCTLAIKNRADRDYLCVNITQVSINSCYQAKLRFLERAKLHSSTFPISPYICGVTARIYVNSTYKTRKRYLVIEYNVYSGPTSDSFRIAVNSCNNSIPANSDTSSENNFNFGSYLGYILVVTVLATMVIIWFKAYRPRFRDSGRSICDVLKHPRGRCLWCCERYDRCRSCTRGCCSSIQNQCADVRCTCCNGTTAQETHPTSSASVSYVSNSESIRDIPEIPDEPPPVYVAPEPSAPPVYSTAIMTPPDYSAYAKDYEAPPPDYDTVLANKTLYMSRRKSE